MLGISGNGNKWKYALGNFFIMFLAQMAWQLYELLALNRFPEAFEIYRAIVTSLVAMCATYGVNKVAFKKKEGEP